MQKPTIGSALALILKVFKVFCAIVILVVIAFAISYLVSFDGCGSAKLSTARAVGSTISTSIQAKHSDYLNNGNDYTLDNVLTDTILAYGIKYQATASNTPANGEITSNVAGIAIILNYGKSNYVWDYTPRNGNTPALLTENLDSDF